MPTRSVPLSVAALATILACFAAAPLTPLAAQIAERPAGPLVVDTPPVSAEPTAPRSDPTVEPPADLAEPGEHAVREPSGLVWRRLGDGQGTNTPDRNATVRVEYVVWSRATGERVGRSPANLPQRMELYTTIDGLREAVTTMLPGERRRLWIPAALAYEGGGQGVPQGDLVMDVTLHDFDPGPEPPARLETPPADAVATDSGLRYVVLEPGGDGEAPGPRDAADVRFTVWRPDGLLLHETPGSSERLMMDATLPGLAEALGAMSEGEHRRLWLTRELATLPGGSNPPDTPIVVDVELIGQLRRIERPRHFTGPAPGADVSITGLASEVVEPGHGQRRPRLGDEVTIEYAGWTRDGEEFDSSFAHGRLSRFTVGERMPLGLSEALMAMVEGERRIVWIPPGLAFEGVDGKPQGMLVFDVTLLEIREDAGS